MTLGEAMLRLSVPTAAVSFVLDRLLSAFVERHPFPGPGLAIRCAFRHSGS